MRLTIEHLSELLRQIPTSTVCDYVLPNVITLRRKESNPNSNEVVFSLFENGIESNKDVTITENALETMANSIKENQPISIDSALVNGGNKRSAIEGALIRTSEFYSLKVGRNKNIVWVPSVPHPVGEKGIWPEDKELPPAIEQDSAILNVKEIEVRDDYTLDELGRNFAAMVDGCSDINDFPGGIGSTCTAFGFRYGKAIKKQGYKSASLVDAANKYGANVSHTHDATISYGFYLYEIIERKLFGMTFKNTKISIKQSSDLSLQQIFYGAPGTGKSHATNEVAEMYDTIRTTFHPDSDYSTFVGAYKPTMNVENRYYLNGTKTEVMKDTDGKEDLKESKIVYKFVKQAFLKAYIKAWQSFKDSCKDSQELTPQFLVIEEINRGNCAQIFGDLFQLLDRKNGFSEYPIEADEDIVKALLDENPDDKFSFGKDGLLLSDEQKAYVDSFFDKTGKPKKNVAEKICKGEVLVLPPNLYIWATMNTSDQSLFPIDSAFKRRWDWKYMKIKDAKKRWKIGVEVKEDEKQDWWAFVQQINRVIANMTSSADKQLGYFFCKPTECNENAKPIGVINKNGQSKEVADSIGLKAPNMFVVEEVDTETEPTIISAETFVSKVVFYLWNDVFKDYGFEDDRLFKYKKTDEDGKETEEDLTFPAFYKDDDENSVDVDVVKQFIKNVMDWKAEETGKE